MKEQNKQMNEKVTFKLEFIFFKRDASKKKDDDGLKQFQKRNYYMKKQQEHEREMLREAYKKMKKDERDEIKQIMK